MPVPEMEGYFVFNYPLKGKKIRVNSSVEIPENFAFAVVVNGKILDILSSGRHRVNGSTMPGVFDKLSLGKPNKNGKLRKSFKAQAYYVNTKVFEEKEFSSSKPFHIRSQYFGRVKGYAEGVANIQIKNIDELLKYLLKRYRVVKPKLAEEEICMLVGNAVNAFVERNKISMEELLLNPNKVNNVLNPAVDDLLYEIGIGAENVSLISLKLTKKMQQKVNEFLSSSDIVSKHLQNVGVSENEQDGNSTKELVTADGKSVNEMQPKEQENANPQTASNYVKDNAVLNDETILPSTGRFSGKVNSPVKQSEPSLTAETENRLNDILKEFKGHLPKPTESNSSLKNENVLESNKDDEVMTSYFNARSSNTSLINNALELEQQQKNYKKQDLNAENVLSSADNKVKQCKYCSSVIDDHFQFCPKCGFKQA